MGTLIHAEVHVSADGEVSKLGTYRFQTLPRVGEILMVGDDPSELWLCVKRVSHIPVKDNDTSWNGLIILNCELEDG